MDLSLMRELVGRSCCRLDSLAEEGNCCTYRIRVGEIRVGESAQYDSVPAVEIPLIG
jgi:hypothetical protein